MRIRKKSLRPLPKLKAECWKWFSLCVRLGEADPYGLTTCITCGTKKHWKELQAGHFHHGCMDFNPINVNVQCSRCNKWLHGNLAVYSTKLEAKYGAGVLQTLEIGKNQAKAKGEKYGRSELVEMIEKFKAQAYRLGYK